MSAVAVYTLFYILLSAGLVYPPPEFISAGLTITRLFSKFLGSENECFIHYHIRRVEVTLLVHTCLPLVYILGLWYADPGLKFSELFFTNATFLWKIFVLVSLVTPMLAAFKVYQWEKYKWRGHPIIKNLRAYCNSRTDWVMLAGMIGQEFRGIDKFSMEMNPITKFIATENWIMKVYPYTIYFAHQRDTTMILERSETYTVSHITGSDVQYITISVKPARAGTKHFTIRLNSLDFKELQDRILRKIIILPNVKFHKTIQERFIDAFKEVIAGNPKYYTSQAPDSCMGCMQQPSNVKLQKQCHLSSTNEEIEANNAQDGIRNRRNGRNVNNETPNACVSCRCGPMWCDECMARWFAHRQDPQQSSTWLLQKCTCPVCRAVFCIKDVSYVVNSE